LGGLSYRALPHPLLGRRFEAAAAARGGARKNAPLLRPHSGDAGGGDEAFLAALAPELACLADASGSSSQSPSRSSSRRSESSESADSGAVALAQCLSVGLGGSLAALEPAGKLAFFGAVTGLLTQGLYAALLQR
jgi:hypothetical protein